MKFERQVIVKFKERTHYYQLSEDTLN